MCIFELHLFHRPQSAHTQIARWKSCACISCVCFTSILQPMISIDVIFCFFRHWNVLSFALQIIVYDSHNQGEHQLNRRLKKRNLTQFIRRSQSNRIRRTFSLKWHCVAFFVSHSNYSPLCLAIHSIYRNNSCKFRIKSLPPNANWD